MDPDHRPPTRVILGELPQVIPPGVIPFAVVILAVTRGVGGFYLDLSAAPPKEYWSPAIGRYPNGITGGFSYEALPGESDEAAQQRTLREIEAELRVELEPPLVSVRYVTVEDTGFRARGEQLEKTSEAILVSIRLEPELPANVEWLDLELSAELPQA